MSPEAKTHPVLMHFRTLGDSIVIVDQGGGASAPFRWLCLGCDDTSTTTRKRDARDGANQHAGTCRSLPKPESED